MSGWPLARVVALPGNGYGLEILTGATPAEIATVVAGLPPAAFVDHTSLDGGTTLLFRRFPRGVPCADWNATGLSSGLSTPSSRRVSTTH